MHGIALRNDMDGMGAMGGMNQSSSGGSELSERTLVYRDLGPEAVIRLIVDATSER